LIKAVLWDLDGTILDTTELIFGSYRYALKKILSIEVSDVEMLSNFGEPLINVMSKYSTDRMDDLIESYREFNLKYHDDFVAPFPGIVDVLANIARRGFKQAIVTSKTERLSRHGLNLFGLDGYFETIVGVESTDAHKPAPDPAIEGLKRLDVAPDEAIFIGDSRVDYLCAGGANVPFVFALWGPNPGAIDRNKADFAIEDPRDVLYIIPERGQRILSSNKLEKT
jgi:pyrophosphatase PpaX